VTRLTFVTSVFEARLGRGEDRVSSLKLPGRDILVVADGAGGVGGGVRAAEGICQSLHVLSDDKVNWVEWISARDKALFLNGTGVAAAVVLSITDEGEICGASAGDCEAWIFGRRPPRSLTQNQHRKPLVGEGSAVPVGFSERLTESEILVVATDGLWKYAKWEKIQSILASAPNSSPELTVDALANSVRLKNGGLQDDVAIVVCVMKP